MRNGDEDIDPCQDRRAVLTYAVAAAEARMRIAPSEVELCRGRSLRIQLQPAVRANGAWTREAPGGSQPEARWLNQMSSDGREIVITVPTDAMQNYPYKFSVEVENVGLLDPRIIVR